MSTHSGVVLLSTSSRMTPLREAPPVVGDVLGTAASDAAGGATPTRIGDDELLAEAEAADNMQLDEVVVTTTLNAVAGGVATPADARSKTPPGDSFAHGQWLDVDVRPGPAAPASDDEDLDPRECRATTSAAFYTGGASPHAQGPSKRAKSGATLWPDPAIAAAAPTAGAHWMGDGRTAPALSTPRMSHHGAALERTAVGTGEGEGRRSRDRGAGVAGGVSQWTHAQLHQQAGGPTEGMAGDVAGEVWGEPTTNEGWLRMLAPLLPSMHKDVHPEDYLHDILRERGYRTDTVSAKESAFYREPSAEQVSAYDKAILRAVRDDDVSALEALRSAGRRVDACNRFGDSMLHMACRRGRIGALRYLLRVCGPSGLALSDDCGRTPMHDACWLASPRFDVASMVLDADTRLLRMLDKRGSSPLQYVPQDQWPLWCAFFESRKEKYWPRLAPGEEDRAGIIPLRA